MALLLQGRSYREVVETAGCSHRDVARAKQVIGANGITSVEGVEDAEVAGWFPDGRRRVSDEYERPEFESVLQALKHRRHFTLLQGWRRYADAAGTGKKKYGIEYLEAWGPPDIASGGQQYCRWGPVTASVGATGLPSASG